jgi:hypothetical protein
MPQTTLNHDGHELRAEAQRVTNIAAGSSIDTRTHFHASPLPGDISQLMSPSLSGSIDQRVNHLHSLSNPSSAQILLDSTAPPLPTYEALISNSFAHGPFFENQESDFQLSPETTTDDGIFLPGSRYQALHNTLRNQVFLTARSAEPSREASPLRNVPTASEIPNQNTASLPVRTFTLGGAAGSELISDTNVVLTAHQEYVLWKNWVDEISAWVSSPIVCAFSYGN